jgi:hypothetical protein
MLLTVGVIEEQLRKFPKGTTVNVGCGCCHHSANGDEAILNIKDYTNQTYGHIEMELNASTQSAEVKLNPDEKEFYEAEIKKLNDKIDYLNSIIDDYKQGVNYIGEDVARLNRILDRKNKNK